MAKITSEELHSSLLNKINEIDNINNVIDTKLSVIENQIYNNEKVSYTTEDGVVAFSSDFNGYTDNVIIKGKTYKNLIIRTPAIVQAEYSRISIIDTDFKEVEPGKEYTYYNFSNKSINVLGLINGTAWSDSYIIPARSKMVITFNANNYLGAILGYYDYGWVDEDLGTFQNSLLIIEGNHIDKEAMHFNGVKSFGQDNGFIISYKKLSANLVDNITIIPNCYVNCLDGSINDHTAFSYSEEYIEIEGGYDYLLENINAQFAIYDSSKNIIPQDWNDTTPYWIKGDKYQSTFVYAMPSNARYIRINLPIENCKPYGLYKVVSDKKDLPVTLRSLPNGVCDTIEKRGNKYVLVKRCEEITINNILDFNVTGTGVTNQVNTRGQNIELPGIKQSLDSPIVCNLFRIEHRNNETIDDEHIINLGNGFFRIRVKKSKLAADNIESYIDYINTICPITLVYELADPEIIELTDIGVQVFEGETTIIVSASPVANDISFDVKTSLDSKMNTVQDRLTALENNITNKMAYLESCLDSIAKIRGVL